MKKIFKMRKNSIAGCKKSLEEMEIPAKHKLTHISERAFAGNEIVKGINIPGNIRIIGYSAFEGAKALQRVSFALAGMVIIKDRCFKKCKKLTEIENMSIIISYGDEAFKGCESLKNCDINPYLVEFGKGCFEGCKKITEVTLPFLHSVVPARAFYECEGLNTVNFCQALEVIGEKAFYGCISLGELTFTENLKKIAASAFEDCYNISKISFGGNVKKIDKNAFKNCRSLNTVEFTSIDGNKKVTIKSGTFNGCSELKKIVIPNGKWSISAGAFRNCRLSAESPLNIYCEDETTAKMISAKLSALVKKGHVNVVCSVEVGVEAEADIVSVETQNTEDIQDNVPEEKTEDLKEDPEEKDVMPENIEEQSLADIFEEDNK